MKSQNTIDPYQVLGIKKDASEAEIKEAYRTLMKENHPDVHQDEKKKADAEDRAKGINTAYDILSDKDKRAEYDMQGNRFGAGSPFETLVRHMGGMGGFHFSGGQDGAFTFFQQRVINAEGEMTLGQMIFGEKEYAAETSFGIVKFDLPPRTEPGQTFNIRLQQDSRGEIILRLQMRLRMPEKVTEEQEKVLRSV
jgi:DnaJ-class molecular chaperone